MHFFNTLSLFTVFITLTSHFCLISGAWWNSGWEYRVPLTLYADGYERFDRTEVIGVNFNELLTALGSSNNVNPQSVRVIEINQNDAIIDDHVPFQYDPVNTSEGELVVVMTGTTKATDKRRYHVYFDVEGKEFDPPSVDNMVTFRDDVMWPEGDEEAQASVHIQNKMGQYYYHKLGGGFASVIDNDGIDWVAWSSSKGSSGEYRGMMNGRAGYHPGYDDYTSHVVFAGPVRVRVQTNDFALWWDFYPNSIACFRVNHIFDTWCYEGVPGGKIDEADNFCGSDNHPPKYQNENGWKSFDEWFYVGDRKTDHILYLGHTGKAQTPTAVPDNVRTFEPTLTNPKPFEVGDSGDSMEKIKIHWPGDVPNPLKFVTGFLTNDSHENNVNRVESERQELTKQWGEPQDRASHDDPTIIQSHRVILGKQSNAIGSQQEIYSVRGRRVTKTQLNRTHPSAIYIVDRQVTIMR